MRCVCCDSEHTVYWKGDYYCNPCRKAIQDTINYDKFNLKRLEDIFKEKDDE